MRKFTKNKTIPRVAFASPCPVCGCTDHTSYEGIVRVPLGKKDGNPTFYVTRYTKCRRCFQKRCEFRIEVPE